MSNIEVKLGKLKLKNPVILASGTFDKSIDKKIDINSLGGIITKTITIEPRQGNPLPHIIKTKYGWLNSAGLKNPGIKKYLKDELPFWKKFDTEVIVSIGGETITEYRKLAKIFNDQPVKAIEVNISCPNIDKGSLAFGIDEKNIKRLVSEVRQISKKSLIIKLTPNITDISRLAESALKAGADILSLTNTFRGLEIDNKYRKAKLFRKIGGYSGGAIKPISLSMVWEVFHRFRCPIIGGGGIEDFNDALDFIMVGASAISIGSANFLDPSASVRIVNDFNKYLISNKLNTINDIKGII